MPRRSVLRPVVSIAYQSEICSISRGIEYGSAIRHYLQLSHPLTLPLELEYTEPLSLGVAGSMCTCDLMMRIHSCWRSSAAVARCFGSRTKHFSRKSMPWGLSCSGDGSCGGLP